MRWSSPQACTRSELDMNIAYMVHSMFAPMLPMYPGSGTPHRQSQ